MSPRMPTRTQKPRAATPSVTATWLVYCLECGARVLVVAATGGGRRGPGGLRLQDRAKCAHVDGAAVERRVEEVLAGSAELPVIAVPL